MRHPDEGTIHAWLDGALPVEDARALQEHVDACADCAARVAEARGLVAGASRILGALDAVPAGVVPAHARNRAPAAAWWRRPAVGMAAAMAIVAVGATMVVTRDWQNVTPTAAESTAPMILGAGDSAMTASPAPEPAKAAQPPSAIGEVEPDRHAAAQRTPDEVAVEATREARKVTADNLATVAVPASPESTRRRLAAEATLGTDTAAAKAEQRVAAGGAASGAAGAARARDSVAPFDARRLADVAPAAPARTEARERAMRAPARGRIPPALLQLAGCYTLDVRHAPDAKALGLPGVIRLAAAERETSVAAQAPPPRAFAPAQVPFVPPAADTGAIGWRLAADDTTIAVRLTSNGRTVHLEFPVPAPEPRVGQASVMHLPGNPVQVAPVVVQRVGCP